MKRLALFTALAALTAPAVLADFSYEQTSKMTGGAMMSLMKIAGAFSKQAKEPIHSSVLVKGDRMAHITGTNAQIIDLSKETITHIDFQKKTYSVMTFAQMADALKQLEADMKEKKDPNQPQMTIKADIKQTGQKRQIQGMETSETILTMDMESADESGRKGGMRVTADMWLAPKIAGYEEVRSFNERMAAKLNWSPGGGMFAQGRSDISKAFANLAKEGAKMDGVPVFQTMKIGGTGDPAQAGGGTPPPQQQQQQAQPAEKPSVGGALGRLGGRFGGLGGLGRKKKDEQPAQQPAETASAAPAAGGGAPGAASLMEMETELTGFSAAAVDGSKLEVPAGFKQVESDMLKKMRK